MFQMNVCIAWLQYWLLEVSFSPFFPRPKQLSGNLLTYILSKFISISIWIRIKEKYFFFFVRFECMVSCFILHNNSIRSIASIYKLKLLRGQVFFLKEISLTWTTLEMSNATPTKSIQSLLTIFLLHSRQ